MARTTTPPRNRYSALRPLNLHNPRKPPQALLLDSDLQVSLQARREEDFLDRHLLLNLSSNPIPCLEARATPRKPRLLVFSGHPPPTNNRLVVAFSDQAPPSRSKALFLVEGSGKRNHKTFSRTAAVCHNPKFLVACWDQAPINRCKALMLPEGRGKRNHRTLSRMAAVCPRPQIFCTLSFRVPRRETYVTLLILQQRRRGATADNTTVSFRRIDHSTTATTVLPLRSSHRASASV